MADTVTITVPVSYQVFQRDSFGVATIAVEGTYTGAQPTGLEGRWLGGAWLPISLSAVGGGTFEGTFSNATAGQGTFEIRDVDSPSVDDSMATVGVGDVFLIAGQSNAAGELENYQEYSGTLVATMWSYANDQWEELADPTGANSAKGSAWPLLATYILADQGVPVAFIPTAVGSTTLVGGTHDWQQGDALYDDAVARYQAAAPGGLRAILWYQGESDANASVSQVDYQDALSQMLDDFQADLGLPTLQLVATLIGEVNGVADEDLDEIRKAIIDRWNNDGDILAGPVAADQDFNDHTHWITDGEGETLAARWWRCLKAHFYGGGLEPARGPQFVSATRTGTTVIVIFDGDVLPLQGHSNVNGWLYTDNGSPVSVSSATSYGSNGVNLTLGGTPSGTELISWLSGDLDADAQLRDSGAIAEVPPEPFFNQSVIVVPSGSSGGRNWFR